VEEHRESFLEKWNAWFSGNREALAVDASCSNDSLTVVPDGRTISAPLVWFPRPPAANPAPTPAMGANRWGHRYGPFPSAEQMVSVGTFAIHG
jgi:hypothetical protein